MKLRCLIVDDEPLAHEVILRYMADTPFLEKAGQCYLATEAIAFLNAEPVDLIFLDIQMPKLTGLNFLRTLKHPPLVIITSAHEEYALESFELQVCDYLLKPFRFDRFLKAANRALSLFTLQQGNTPATTVPPKADTATGMSPLYVKADKKLIQLQPEQLYYLESLGNYVKVWDEKKYLLTQRTLSSFEEQLPADMFVRIHKSYIINRRHVQYIEGNLIRLTNGKELPLGKNYRHAIKQLLL
ncbi:MAG: LytTR family DNA-binding domain-containing protein [Chitinophagaceae bacterium]